jgi:hypothetical protein
LSVDPSLCRSTVGDTARVAAREVGAASESPSCPPEHLQAGLQPAAPLEHLQAPWASARQGQVAAQPQPTSLAAGVTIAETCAT